MRLCNHFHIMRNPALALGLASMVVGLGCTGSSTPTQAELPPPMVTVAPPTPKSVLHYEHFTGRVEPPEQVEIRARVSGYLKKIHFKRGTDVKKDEPLFDIDPDIYQAELAQAEAAQALADARAKRLAADYQRMVKTKESTGSVSQQEFDKVVGDKLEADAAVTGAKAKVASAKLNLGYTKIASPIAGRIGDYLVTEGNLITGGQGSANLLTTVVAVDPMDVSFDIDEPTLQVLQQGLREGKIKQVKDNEFPVDVGLAVHGTNYPLKGIINFANNKVDTKTGTIRLKAMVANPKPENGARLLTAGMYARVRVPIGEPVASFLVPDAAIGSDQGAKFLFGVGADNKAIRLDAKLGGLDDTMRVIESVQGPGDTQPRPLRPDEKIIVSGLQRVRPGMTVDPKPLGKK